MNRLTWCYVWMNVFLIRTFQRFNFGCINLCHWVFGWVCNNISLFQSNEFFFLSWIDAKFLRKWKKHPHIGRKNYPSTTFNGEKNSLEWNQSFQLRITFFPFFFSSSCYSNKKKIAIISFHNYKLCVNF